MPSLARTSTDCVSSSCKCKHGHSTRARSLDRVDAACGMYASCTISYGLKGTAAYAAHAGELGKTSDGVHSFIHRALADLAQGQSDVSQLLGLALGTGEANLQALQILDEGHNERCVAPATASTPSFFAHQIGSIAGTATRCQHPSTTPR